MLDAEGQTLGRMATLAASFIRGKHLPWFSDSMDMGGVVVVVNAEKCVVSGRKADQKTYFRHTTGRPGNYKIETFRELQARLPERIVEKAVWGMIPKGRRHRRSPAPAPAPSLWGTKGGIHCFTGSDVKGTRLSPPISAPACPPSREGPPARL